MALNDTLKTIWDGVKSLKSTTQAADTTLAGAISDLETYISEHQFHKQFLGIIEFVGATGGIPNNTTLEISPEEYDLFFDTEGGIMYSWDGNAWISQGTIAEYTGVTLEAADYFSVVVFVADYAGTLYASDVRRGGNIIYSADIGSGDLYWYYDLDTEPSAGYLPDNSSIVLDGNDKLSVNSANYYTKAEVNSTNTTQNNAIALNTAKVSFITYKAASDSAGLTYSTSNPAVFVYTV
jgi:hypothetical protein